jgi:hypothetical protein
MFANYFVYSDDGIIVGKNRLKKLVYQISTYIIIEAKLFFAAYYMDLNFVLHLHNALMSSSILLT